MFRQQHQRSRYPIIPAHVGFHKFNPTYQIISSFAYVLLNLLREELLHHTKLANARVGTIRDQLLKVGTLIRISVRRIYLAMHSSFPNQDLFYLVFQRLAAMADSSG